MEFSPSDFHFINKGGCQGHVFREREEDVEESLWNGKRLSDSFIKIEKAS